MFTDIDITSKPDDTNSCLAEQKSYVVVAFTTETYYGPGGHGLEQWWAESTLFGYRFLFPDKSQKSRTWHVGVCTKEDANRLIGHKIFPAIASLSVSADGQENIADILKKMDPETLGTYLVLAENFDYNYLMTPDLNCESVVHKVVKYILRSGRTQ